MEPKDGHSFGYTSPVSGALRQINEQANRIVLQSYPPAFSIIPSEVNAALTGIAKRYADNIAIDLSGVLDNLPEWDLPEAYSPLQTPEAVRAFEEINRTIASSFRLDTSLFAALEESFKLNPPGAWTEAVERIEQTPGAKESVERLMEDHPEEVEEIRASFLAVAEQTPFDMLEKQVEWALRLVGECAFYVATSAVGVSIPVGLFLFFWLAVQDYPQPD